MPINQQVAASEDNGRQPLTAKKFWQYFVNLPDTRTFYTTWLAQQFQRIADLKFGVLMFPDTEAGTLVPAAAWPDPRIDPSYLSKAIEAAFTQREPIVLREGDAEEVEKGFVHVAIPLQQGTEINGVLVLDLRERPEPTLRAVIDQLQWHMGWLLSRLSQEAVERQRLASGRSAFAMDILAVAAEHELVEQACMAVANEVAVKMACDRVSIGLVRQRRQRGGRIRLRAMSHSAWYRKKTSLVDELENAMEEALDQHATVVYPRPPHAAKRIFIAHKEYAENWKVRHMASFVMTDKSVPVGVLTIERREDGAFDEETLKRGENIASLIGPVLDLKRRERRWVSGRIADAIRRWSRKLFGPRHPALKLLATLLLVVLVFLLVYPVTFRVSGDAVLEGASQRVSVVPFDGFIDEAPVRAGDIVDKGELLATLDDKDLRIDALRWESELARLQQQQRQALVGKERTEIALLEAQIRQTEAQLELSRQQLARTAIRAPVSGLVIAGDLSQKLGSPVQKGDTLFEIAPLDGYRVVLKIDERDVRFVEAGYPGHLLLSGMAGRSIPMTVTNVTAVSEAGDGLNYFRVEAALDDTSAAVRPGMEGVGKIDIDTRSLAWIWTRTFMNWLRVTWWEWTP